MYNDSKKGSLLLYIFLFYGANLSHALVLSDPSQVETGEATGRQYENLSTLTSRMGLASEDNMEEREDEVRTYVGGVDDGTCLITRCLVLLYV
jgi:hypothetical protein